MPLYNLKIKRKAQLISRYKVPLAGFIIDFCGDVSAFFCLGDSIICGFYLIKLLLHLQLMEFQEIDIEVSWSTYLSDFFCDS